jgi:hypothetical protein
MGPLHREVGTTSNPDPADTMSAASPLDSKEFKMLLDPQKFTHLKKGKEKLWDKVEEAADEAGVEVKKAKKDHVRTQDIIFLDTEDHALNSQGYILRYRDVHGSSKADNLTLKFRDSDPERVAKVNVDAAPGVKAKPKFELDETFQDGETAVYSKSTKVRLPHLPEATVDKLTGVFPALADLGLSPDTRLKEMHGGSILEERHLLGDVKIGEQESAPAFLTLWYDDAHGETPVIAEFSFAHGVHDQASGVDEASEDLMRNLRDNAPKWLSHGSTKTNFAYSE